MQTHAVAVKSNVAHQWVKSISDARDQLHVTCSSDPKDDSCFDMECKCNALNDARTCTMSSVESLPAQLEQYQM